MDRRFIAVLLAGLVLIGVCAWRLQTNRPYDYDAHVSAAMSANRAPAPLFEGLDEINEMYRLAAYLGRHRILIVFYDGAAGADANADLLAIREHAAEMPQLDLKVVAVSQAIPQQNRAALKRLGDFPGPLVSDVDGTIHRQWGRLTSDGRPLTGLFLIDRKGSVAVQGGAPRPYADFDSLWKDVVRR
jgi:peroxiredoxin